MSIYVENVTVIYGIHNHELDQDIVSHDILGRLKSHERQFLNEMRKYNMASRFIIVS